MFDLLLVAQLAGDMPCYGDFGAGPINLTYMCGMSGGGPAALPEVGPQAATLGTDEYVFDVTSLEMPGLWACAEQRSDAAVGSLAYESGDFDRFLEDCADEIPVVANYISPEGTLQITRPQGDNGFFVRVPNGLRGYGPFDRQSDARSWAEVNYG